MINPAAMAPHLSDDQLKTAIQDGTMPAYIGIPILQQRMQVRSQAQAQQQQKPSVAQQVLQGLDQLKQRQQLPIPAQQNDQSFKSGGMVDRYAEGGLADIDEIKQRLSQYGIQPEENRTISSYLPSTGSLGQLWPGATKSPADIKQIIANEAMKRGINPSTALAIAKTESNFNPSARNSDSSATGPMQMTKAAANQVGYSHGDMLNPASNISAGLDYLNWGKSNLQNKFGEVASDPDVQLAGYNQGVGAVSKLISQYGADWKSHLPREGADYLKKIHENEMLFAGENQPQAAAYNAQISPQQISPDYVQQQLTERQALLGSDEDAAAIKEKLAKMESSSQEEKDKAPWKALMQAGLATMAGQSPYALSNIGAGGMKGLDAYEALQRRIADEEKDRLTTQAVLGRTNRAEKLGNINAAFASRDAAQKAANDLAEKQATLGITGQHYAASDEAQRMNAQAAMKGAESLGEYRQQGMELRNQQSLEKEAKDLYDAAINRLKLDKIGGAALFDENGIPTSEAINRAVKTAMSSDRGTVLAPYLSKYITSENQQSKPDIQQLRKTLGLH